MAHQVGSLRPGGRTARTRRAVYEAIRALVRETGSDPVSIAQVANRAGVSPATVYRRWGSLETLLLEVVVDELNSSSALASSGDLRTDLEAYGRGIVRGFEGPGDLRFLGAIMAATGSAEAGPRLTMELVGRRLDRVAAMLAVSEPDGVLTPLDVVDGLVGPLYFRALTGGRETVTMDDVVRLADNLVAVAEHRRQTGVRFADGWPPAGREGPTGAG